MDIEKLIEQVNRFWVELRRDGGEFEYSIGKKFLNCATALSTLQAENEKLRAELEQVKRERDGAVECIREIAKSGRVWMCPYCVHSKDTTGGIAECELDVGVCMMPYSKFEWRGPKKGGLTYSRDAADI